MNETDLDLLPSRVFPALGVLFDFTRSGDGHVVLRNKESRVDEIVRQLDEVLSSGILMPTHAERLRGKLRYASYQTFGRCGAMAFRELGLRAHAARTSSWSLTSTLEIAVRWWRHLLRHSPPRDLQLFDRRSPAIKEERNFLKIIFFEPKFRLPLKN